MDTKRRRTAGIMSLVALCISGTGLAGCGTASDAGSSGETACPRGLTNDPYPGACHIYVDSDGDNICDYSQTTQEDSAQLSGTGASGDSEQQSAGGCPLAPCSICGICAGLS